MRGCADRDLVIIIFDTNSDVNCVSWFIYYTMNSMTRNILNILYYEFYDLNTLKLTGERNKNNLLTHMKDINL